MPKRPRADNTTTSAATIDLTEFDSRTLSYNNILPKHNTVNTNSTDNSSNEILFIAVHGGAGKHSTHKHTALKQLMSDACNIGIQCNNTVDAVCKTLQYMEQSELVNAGIGSSLDSNKQQSMDSCICYYNNTDQSNEWCGVGNVSNVQSPIEVAACMLRDRLDMSDLSCSRVKPILLCGSDVQAYAAHMLGNDAIVQPTISDKLKSKWLKYANMLKSHTQTSHTTDDNIPQHSTIGCIVGDREYNICCGSSSGGLWMKIPGRVGHSAIATAAAYVQSVGGNPAIGLFGDKDRSTRAVCYSGIGEELLRCNAAQMFCQHSQAIDVSKKVMTNKLGNYGRIGVNTTHYLVSGSVNNTPRHEVVLLFHWQSTTPQFAVAYQGNKQWTEVQDLYCDSFVTDEHSDKSLGFRVKQ